MSLWANFFNDCPGSFTEIFPQIDMRYVTLRMNLVMPFFREICLALGCIDSERSTIESNLTKVCVRMPAVCLQFYSLVVFACMRTLLCLLACVCAALMMLLIFIFTGPVSVGYDWRR